jgi:4-hydroxybenzoate polyprenyltransferase
LIAIIWVIAVGIVELVNENIFDFEKWMFALIHYFYIVAVTIPFDIRDLKYDDAKKKTIPQVVGVKKAKWISFILILLYTILIVFLQSNLLYNPLFFASIFVTIILISGIKESRNEFYFSGLIEGSILLVGLSLIIKS